MTTRDEAGEDVTIGAVPTPSGDLLDKMAAAYRANEGPSVRDGMPAVLRVLLEHGWTGPGAELADPL